jgi:hypothetical protein
MSYELNKENIKKLEKLGYLEIIKKDDHDYNPEYLSIRFTQKGKDWNDWCNDKDNKEIR